MRKEKPWDLDSLNLPLSTIIALQRFSLEQYQEATNTSMIHTFLDYNINS